MDIEGQSGISLTHTHGSSAPAPQEASIQAVEVRRSARRKRTVSARVEKGTLLLFLPERTSSAEEAMWIEKMRERFEARKRKQRINSAGDLERRARELNRLFFGGNLRWQSIQYVTNQGKRHGSCNTKDATIRLSDSLADMPGWVRDYVIVHELAHLLVPNHSKHFWNLVEKYPLCERARGYLIAKDMDQLDSP